MSVLYGSCFDANCVSISTLANDGGSCWADSAALLFTYPLHTRASVIKAMKQLESEPFLSKNDKRIISLVRQLLSLYVVEYISFKKSQCPRKSPARTLYDLLCNDWEETEDELTQRLHRPHDGFWVEPFMKIFALWVSFRSAAMLYVDGKQKDAAQLGETSWDNPSRSIFYELPPGRMQKLPLELTSHELVGFTFTTSAHQMTLVRCNHDAETWMLMDAFEARKPDLAWSVTKLSFSLSQINPFESGSAPWRLVVDSKKFDPSLKGVLLYTPKQPPPTHRCGKENQLWVTLTSGKMTFADMLLASLARPTPIEGAWQRVVDAASRTAPRDALAVIEDLHTQNGFSANEYTGNAAEEVLTGILGRASSDDWARDVHVLNRLVGKSATIQYRRSSGPELTHKETRRAVAAFYRKGDHSVLAVRRNWPASNWSIVACDTAAPDQRTLKAEIVYNEDTLMLFNGITDSEYVMYYKEGRVGFDLYDSVIVYMP
jgi:hypothetical protein